MNPVDQGMDEFAFVSDQYGEMDQMPIGVCLVRADLVVLFWNIVLEDWTGIPREDIVGTPLISRFPRLAEPRYMTRLNEIFSGGPPAVFSSQIHRSIFPGVTHSGLQRIQETTVSAVHSPNEDLYYAMFAVQDVTDLTDRIEAYHGMYQQAQREIALRLTAEREREEAIAERIRINVLRQFISDASHDLNTPLTGIKIALYLLGKAGEFTDKQKQYLITVNEQVERISEMLAQMFNLLRLDDAETFEALAVDLTEVITAAAQAVQKKINEHKHHFDLQCAPDLRVLGDRDYLYKAFMELLDNAIRYTPKGGELGLYAVREINHAIIRVQDNGKGIDPEILDRIFDSFYRADTSRNPDVGGAGLGLSIARKIFELHGATVRIDSRVNEGTTFIIRLPLV